MRHLIAAALTLAVTGCSEAQAPGPAPETAPRAPASVAAAPVAAGENIKLEDAQGALRLKIKPKDDGFKAYDAQDQELGKAKVESDRVKLKDAQDRDLWKIKRKDVGAEIEDGSGTRLFRLKPDGLDWKMEDASGTTVLKLKKKDTGYEARDAAGATLVKAKVREGKVVFETEEGTRQGQADGLTDPRAAVWLGLERFSMLERMALFAYFQKVAP